MIDIEFIRLPVDRLVEVVLDFDESGGSQITAPPDLEGCRIKLILNVPEEVAESIDPEAERQEILKLGASHVKTPEVRIIRKDVQRDDRHHIDVPLEESLRMFAEETQISDSDRRVEFAATLAREADQV